MNSIINDLLENLLNEFDKRNIEYVHWKSNTNIDCALSGVDDFDVLVNPKDEAKTKELLNELSFIRAFSNKDTWQNGIFHYLGMDIEQKKIVHIHLHFQLELGYDFDKNTNLPIVDNYLSNPIRYKYVNIPEVEKEYILLVLRLILKNAFVPFALMLPTAQFKYLRNAKKNGVISGGGYREFKDLGSRLDNEKLEIILKESFPFISLSSFREYEKTIQNNNSIIKYFRNARKLKKEIKFANNHSELKSVIYSFYRINLGRIHTLIKNKIYFKKKSAYGGRIIAFVGGDGAGKSSNIEKLHNILKRYFYTEVIHIGRPRRYIIGLGLRFIAKVLSFLKIKSLSTAISYIALAYNRKQEFNYALKLKNKGAIVLLDRIPLDGITAMDCPRVYTLEKNNPLFDFLSKIEQNIYKDIKGVDALIALKLNPEIALQRRPEDDPDELRIRSGQIWNKDFTNIDNAYAIDTSNTFDYVEKNILNIVWNTIKKKSTIYELLGTAGTGKSTTFKLLEKENTYNMHFNVYYNKNVFSIIKNIPMMTYILIKTRKFQFAKAFLAYKLLLEGFLLKTKLNNKTFIFDQGPIFIIILLIKEIPELKEYFIKDLNKIFLYFEGNIYLNASTETLKVRIKSREQEHRIKDNKEDEQVVFIEEYKKLFDKILTIANNSAVKITYIDTDRFSPEEVVNIISKEINKKDS